MRSLSPANGISGFPLFGHQLHSLDLVELRFHRERLSCSVEEMKTVKIAGTSVHEARSAIPYFWCHFGSRC